MLNPLRRLILAPLALLFMALTAWSQSVVSPTFASSSLPAYPPYLGAGVGGPMMMLTASRDHTLFAPIYTDYEDIDGDGVVDYTFKPTFRYYGYFDAEKCYGYDDSVGQKRFKPVAMAVVSGGRFTCASGASQWAGNFLNWATMTRLDVVRKILYGGRRVLDSADDTTLEMAALAHDAHAFVKHYSGSDIGDYTPFTSESLGGAGLTLCSRGDSEKDQFGTVKGALGLGYPVIRIAKGNYSLWATTPGTVCNWSEDQNFSFGEKPQAFYQKYGPKGASGSADPTAHRAELPSSTSNGGKYGAIGPELAVRVQVCVKETDAIKRGGERCQSYKGVSKPIGLLQMFGTSEGTKQPTKAEFGLITGSYDGNLRGGKLRKNVGSFNDEIDLNSGRFCHTLPSGTKDTTCPSPGSTISTSGSIVQSFDKIRLYDAGNYDRNGAAFAFAFPREVSNGLFPSWGNPMSEMVTQALAYFAGLPIEPASSPNNKGTARDAEVGLPSGISRKDPLDDTALDPVAGVARRDLYGRAICRPMHMLAISSGAVTHDTFEGDTEDVYGTSTAFMTKNVPEKGISTIQAATHTVGDQEGINNSSRSVGSVTAGFGSDCTAKDIGTVVSNGLAQVAGVCPEAPAVKGSYLGAGAAFIANTRAIRSLSELTEATGRSVDTARMPAESLRVRSYAATLSGGVARVDVPIPGKPGKFVYITPESSWDFSDYRETNGELMPGAMLTFRAIHSEKDDAKQTASASYVVTWNDTQFGGDYDMDIVGFLRWEIEPSSVLTGGFKLTVLTDILNQEAGAKGSHGFSVMGTVKKEDLPSKDYVSDGRYLTHGGMGYKSPGSDCIALSGADFRLLCNFSEDGMDRNDRFSWPTKIDGLDVNFYGSSAPKTTTVAKTFLVKDGASDVTLRDPLWYIAKYGSFDTGEKSFAVSTSAVPAKANGANPVNWDSESNNGTACGSQGCADGEPDGYFLARRPELLEKRLVTLLGKISEGSNSAPATSSVQVVTNTLKYTAEFYTVGYGGTVKAFRFLDTGEFATEPKWNATMLMKDAGSNRTIITDDGRAGVYFDETSLGVDEQLAYRAALLGMTLSASPSDEEKASVALGTTRVKELIDYMRGGSNLAYRERKDGAMGPIVNSTPWLQSSELAARFTDATFPGAPSYRAHVNRFQGTDASPNIPVLWVGSNDGMLHGLNATSGEPILSYVPSPLVGRLDAALSSNNSGPVALVDGSPYTADVLVAKATTGFGSVAPADHAWRTYLFGSLGRGGRAVFAIDVSTPADLADKAKAPSAFKWVFSSQDDADMGYQLLDPVRHPGSGQPSQVIALNSGGFGLLVPNGYGSPNGRAALFILSMNGPAAGAWQETTASSRGSFRKVLLPDQTGGNNGLMGATWVDLDNNGTADVVYATDLRGNLWKFDIRSSDPTDWGSALVNTSTTEGTLGDAVSLFSTASRSTTGTQFLPITTAPVTYFPNFGGVMVAFGTGRAIESADFPDLSRTQRFISVWDKGRYPGDLINPPVGTGVGEVNDRPRLGAQRDVKDAGGQAVKVNTFVERILRRDDKGDVYQVQTNELGNVVTDSSGKEAPMTDLVSAQQFKPAVNDGWYFDFPSDGEAVINSPVRRLNFLIFTTVRPKSDQEKEAACTVAPQGALFAFSPVSGLPILNLFDAGGLVMGVNVDDLKVTLAGDASGASYTTGGKTKTIALGNKDDRGLTSSASNLRIQWREVTGMRTRSSKAK